MLSLDGLIAYVIKTCAGFLMDKNSEEISILWDQFLSNPIELLVWHTMFIGLTMWVVARGIHRGVELASKIMMPGLLLILILLVCYNLKIGDMTASIKFLFQPNFSSFKASMIIEAIGQAVFSLATGAGCMLVYGCYLSENTNIIKSTSIIVSMILLVSILSGLTVFPLVFKFNLPLAEGPGLMFKVLPIAFNNMPFGSIIGSLFFGVIMVCSVDIFYIYG